LRSLRSGWFAFWPLDGGRLELSGVLGGLLSLASSSARRCSAGALETATDGGSLGTLAFECGYSDLSAFGKAFRRRFGMSPSEWRAQR
jgi:methylphosphotriester-DNA--protein-cysteine methyltransferase